MGAGGRRGLGVGLCHSPSQGLTHRFCSVREFTRCGSQSCHHFHGMFMGTTCSDDKSIMHTYVCVMHRNRPGGSWWNFWCSSTVFTILPLLPLILPKHYGRWRIKPHCSFSAHNNPILHHHTAATVTFTVSTIWEWTQYRKTWFPWQTSWPEYDPHKSMACWHHSPTWNGMMILIIIHIPRCIGPGNRARTDYPVHQIHGHKLLSWFEPHLIHRPEFKVFAESTPTSIFQIYHDFLVRTVFCR